MTAETVLITGASSGIGRELARCFAEGGSDVVLVARREDRLRELAQELTSRYDVKTHALPKDLNHPAAGREIENELRSAGIRVDVLVNNAGFGDRGSFAEIGIERQMKMVQVNVSVVTELTRRFLPGMIERRRGGVLNVASTAAFQPGPHDERLLRHEGLCPSLFGGDRGGTCRDRGVRDMPLSRTYGHGIRCGLPNGWVAALSHGRHARGTSRPHRI